MEMNLILGGSQSILTLGTNGALPKPNSICRKEGESFQKNHGLVSEANIHALVSSHWDWGRDRDRKPHSATGCYGTPASFETSTVRQHCKQQRRESGRVPGEGRWVTKMGWSKVVRHSLWPVTGGEERPRLSAREI